MCDLLTDPYLESLRGKSAVLDRLMVALNETFPATPAADTNPCVDAELGTCPPLTVEQAKDILAWHRPQH